MQLEARKQDEIKHNTIKQNETGLNTQTQTSHTVLELEK